MFLCKYGFEDKYGIQSDYFLILIIIFFDSQKIFWNLEIDSFYLDIYLDICF